MLLIMLLTRCVGRTSLRYLLHDGEYNYYTAGHKWETYLISVKYWLECLLHLRGGFYFNQLDRAAQNFDIVLSMV